MAITLRGGHTTEDRRLDRVAPSDDEHVRKYALAAAPEGALTAPVPVVLGINWYSNFDRPVQVRVGGRTEWWIGRGALGYVRGGHCVCVPHDTGRDPAAWWRLMDQGQEGACVGFGSTRAMMLLNRRRYSAHWLYWQAQQADEWPGGSYPGASPQYEGTTVRAAFDVLRDQGHLRVVRGREAAQPSLADGIAANRWATQAQECLEALGSPARYVAREAVPILNSWGASYPHVVWLPLTVLQRLLDEQGEATVLTDR